MEVAVTQGEHVKKPPLIVNKEMLVMHGIIRGIKSKTH